MSALATLSGCGGGRSGDSASAMPTARPSATARAALVQSGSATEDFEAGMADWQNWGNSQVVSGAGTSGSNALQVGAGAGGAGLQVPGLVAGTTYRLTAQVRATDPMGGPTTMGVDFYDASGARVLTTYTPHVTSTSFAPLTFQVEAPAGTSYALVWIWKDGTSGFAYLDDFAFAADSLSNSGFEAGMTDWVDWGNTSVVSGQANSGSFALSVGTAAGGAGHYVEGIVAGTTYRLSASAKVSDAAETVFVGVNMLDAAGEQVGTTQLHLSTTSTSYVTLSGDTTAPPGAVRAQV